MPGRRPLSVHTSRCRNRLSTAVIRRRAVSVARWLSWSHDDLDLGPAPAVRSRRPRRVCWRLRGRTSRSRTTPPTGDAGGRAVGGDALGRLAGRSGREWHESALPLGGEGCPEVAEFAVVEFAAALGRSTESGRRYLSQAVEGCYRLRRCWGRLEAGELAAWRLGFIAERTMCLSPAGRGVRGRHVAAVAHKIGPAQLDAVDRGGQGQVRPRSDRGRTPSGRRGPAPRRRPGPREHRRDGPRRGRPGPGRRDRLQRRGRRRRPRQLLSAPPSPWTYAAPSPPATSPATSSTLELTDDREPHPGPVARGGAARPPLRRRSSWAPVGSPGSRRPPARSPPNRSASGAPTPTRR